jgi:hypothetical protein
MCSFANEDEISSKSIDKYVNDVQEGKRIVASEILAE